MRVALTLEAQDKASRAIRAMSASVAGLNSKTVAGASKAAAATEKANRAVAAGARAAKGAEKAAAGLSRASVAGARQAAQAHQRTSRASQMLTQGYAALGRGARGAGDAARAAGRLAEQGWRRALVAVESYARRQANLVKSGFARMGGGAQRIGQGMMAGGRIAAGAAMGAGILGGATMLVSSQLLKPAASLQKYSMELERTEKSAAGAHKALKWIDDFSVKAHTGLEDVTAAFVHMRKAAFQPMDGSFKTLGNASAALGIPMADAAQAMAAATKGNMAGLEDFGITAQKVGRRYRFTFEDAAGKQRHLYARTKETAAVQRALLHILDNKYGGAMDKAAGSWDGMTMRMQNQFGRFQNIIMRGGLFDWMNERMTGVLDSLDAMAADGSLEKWGKDVGTGLQEAMTIGWEAAKGVGTALLELAKGARALALAMGGWENFAYLALAASFSGPLFTIASGLFLISRGALTAAFAVARLALMFTVSLALTAAQTTLQLTWLAMRAGVGATMLLGRSLIFLTAAAGKVAIAAGIGLVRGLMALPGALLATGRALIGLPGRLLAFARAITAMTIAGLRALPGLLMGAARGLVAMAAAGLRALPGLLAGAARGIALMAASGLKALPGLLMAAGRGFLMLGASLMATPIGWFIAGVAAIAAAAYLIYANWDSIGPWFAAQWEAVKTAFSDAWNALANYDWASLIPDIDWKSWLPAWDWLELIPAIALPSFAWRELLPAWDWSSIIPSLPDFGSWFGGETQAAPAPSIPAPATTARVPLPPVKPAMPVGDPKALAEQAAQAQKAIEALRPAAQAAVAAASAALSGTSFHSHGVALMTTLAAGIKAGAGSAVTAVQGVTRQMRDYLPHSPAKVGPLSDLDRIRFSETLAGAIRPGPAVKAAMSVAAGMRAAVAAPVTAGLAFAPMPASAGLMPQQAPVSAGLPLGGISGGGASATTITVSAPLTVNISGNASKDTVRQLEFRLRDHADEIGRIIDEHARRNARKEF